MNLKRKSLFIAAILFSLSVSSPAFTPPAPRLPKNAIPLPIIDQGTDYSCGVAALLSILSYWRAYEGHEASLYSVLNTTPKDGTEPGMMVEGARKFGLEAEMRENVTISELKQALRSGVTVILDIQAWVDEEVLKKKSWSEIWDNGHYVNLVGMDHHYAYFMDPSVPTSYAFIPLGELVERWHDYENRTGTTWRNYQLAIFIHGTQALTQYPSELVPIE